MVAILSGMFSTMRHTRTFFPVGHGAFFVEKLDYGGERPLIAVYDCGDSAKGALVQKYAQQEFGKTDNDYRIIDVLFISHFDSDHINGLEYIKPYITQNTRVFLPFFYDKYKKLYKSSKQEGIKIILKILSDAGIKPILVKYQEEGQPADFDLDKPLADGDHVSNDSPYPVIPSGTPVVKSTLPIWKYVPYNLFNEAKLFHKFRAEIKASKNWSEGKLNTPDTWTKDEIRELRQIYSTFSTYSINSNSLIVLSKPIITEYMFMDKCLGEYIQDGYLVKHDSCHPTAVVASSLYTGDTVLKRGSVGKYHQAYLHLLARLNLHTNRVGIMQIPHHGSSNNVNITTLADCISCTLFCNYGINDIRNKTFFLKSTLIKTVWKDILRVTEKTKPIIISLQY